MPAKRTNAAILLTIVSIILSAIVSLSILFRLRIFCFIGTYGMKEAEKVVQHDF